MKTLLFDVKGMTCDNCVHHVTQAIQDVAGVTSVKVDLASNSATVEGEDVDVKRIVDAVEEEGYEAALASA